MVSGVWWWCGSGPLLAAASAGSLAAVVTVVVLMPSWLRTARRRGLVGRDMNKHGHPPVAEAGGLVAVLGGVMGLYTAEVVVRYVYGVNYYTAEVYALTSLLLLSLVIGLLDDLLGWKKGLPRWVRIAAMAPAALPLVAIKAGVPRMELPLVGVVDLGVLYPLVVVPVGVLGAANAFNMIAGYNGLEAGMGLILLLSAAAYSYIKGLELPLVASLVMAAAIAAFLWYNWYPARAFPGNVFTYSIGAYFAGVVVLGNFEKFGLLLFTLYFVKAGLYFAALACGECRRCLEEYEDFSIPQEDGSIRAPPCRSLSLPHYMIRLQERLRGRATEQGVTLAMLGLQAVISIILLAAAYKGLV
jgi:UDP-N-acetylglucosamine--dolichyl-phosphate N-acetylglucosaminephosphotransferase